MKIIEFIKGYWRKKQDVQNQNKHLSDEELKQKKDKFQSRKTTIDDYMHVLKACSFNNSSFELNNTIINMLDVIDTARFKLRRFDKYDITNPCMTYDEYYNMVINDYRAIIMNISEDAFTDIYIEVLVYYAANKSYLHSLLNECNDDEYQSYCGMFKDDVVILLVDLGFKSLFG